MLAVECDVDNCVRKETNFLFYFRKIREIFVFKMKPEQKQNRWYIFFEKIEKVFKNSLIETRKKLNRLNYTKKKREGNGNATDDEKVFQFNYRRISFISLFSSRSHHILCNAIFFDPLKENEIDLILKILFNVIW